MSEEEAQAKKIEEEVDSDSDAENDVDDAEELKGADASGVQDVDMEETEDDKKQRACRQSTCMGLFKLFNTLSY